MKGLKLPSKANQVKYKAIVSTTLAARHAVEKLRSDIKAEIASVCETLAEEKITALKIEAAHTKICSIAKSFQDNFDASTVKSINHAESNKQYGIAEMVVLGGAPEILVELIKRDANTHTCWLRIFEALRVLPSTLKIEQGIDWSLDSFLKDLKKTPRAVKSGVTDPAGNVRIAWDVISKDIRNELSLQISPDYIESVAVSMDQMASWVDSVKTDEKFSQIFSRKQAAELRNLFVNNARHMRHIKRYVASGKHTYVEAIKHLDATDAILRALFKTYLALAPPLA
jgi:hypothetical protein